MKTLLLFIAIISSVELFAQNNELNYNSVWYNHNVVYWTECIQHDYFNDYFNGDTIINGNQYFKLYRSNDHWITPKSGVQPQCNYNIHTYTNAYTGALVRYFNKKLITRNYYFGTSNVDETFIDYDLNVGDTLKNIEYLSYISGTIVVLSIDSILINGIYHKKFNFYNSGEPGNGIRYLLDKIGSYHGFLSRRTIFFEEDNRLICYAENGVTVYSDPEFAGGYCNLTVGLNTIEKNSAQVSIFPNPITNYFTITTNSNSALLSKVIIKNNLGEIVSEQSHANSDDTFNTDFLKSGIYFVEVYFGNESVVKKIVKL